MPPYFFGLTFRGSAHEPEISFNFGNEGTLALIAADITGSLAVDVEGEEFALRKWALLLDHEGESFAWISLSQTSGFDSFRAERKPSAPALIGEPVQWVLVDDEGIPLFDPDTTGSTSTPDRSDLAPEGYEDR